MANGTYIILALSGLYFTCDMAHRDADGDYQIVCRASDVIRIEGVWIGFTEIESVMVSAQYNNSKPYLL